MAILDLIYSARDIAQVPSEIATQMSEDTDFDTSEYRAVQYAVKQYSIFNPRNSAVSFSPTGVKLYDLTNLIIGYKKSSHRITDIIYPFDDTSFDLVGPYDQNKIDINDWTVSLNPLQNNKPYLRFLNGSEPPSDSVRKVVLFYTGPHIVDDSSDTITDEEPDDTEAFANLIASRILLIASHWFTRLDDPTIDIQIAETGTKSTNYSQRSKDCFRLFKEHMEMKTEHSGRINWDSFSTWGEERFWYDSRWR